MGNASQNLPIAIIQAATLIKTIYYLDPNGDPVNLTSYTAKMMFRTTVEDTGSPIISLSTDDGSIVINASLGIVTITISSAITSLLLDGQQMVYDLFLYSPTGIVTPLLAGPACVYGSTIR